MGDRGKSSGSDVVDTCTVKRRALRFDGADDYMRELGVIEGAHREGRLKRLGNREPGVILDHLARSIRRSMEGATGGMYTAPFLLRLIGPLVKRRVLTEGLIPGRNVGADAERVLWNNQATFESGMRDLRDQVVRLSRREFAVGARHPIFGRLTADEWMQFHLRHAELHLGFLQP